jgi:hypothetical protein
LRGFGESQSIKRFSRSLIRRREPMLLRRIAPWSAVLLAGCATAVTTADGQRLKISTPEFRAYVEGVFRAQNRVATDLGFALEDAADGSREAATLSAAEDTLLGACADLNELATLRRDDRHPGLGLRLDTARSAPRCEAATRDAERALQAAR